MLLQKCITRREDQRDGIALTAEQRQRAPVEGPVTFVDTSGNKRKGKVRLGSSPFGLSGLASHSESPFTTIFGDEQAGMTAF